MRLVRALLAVKAHVPTFPLGPGAHGQLDCLAPSVSKADPPPWQYAQPEAADATRPQKQQAKAACKSQPPTTYFQQLIRFVSSKLDVPGALKPQSDVSTTCTMSTILTTYTSETPEAWPAVPFHNGVSSPDRRCRRDTGMARIRRGGRSLSASLSNRTDSIGAGFAEVGLGSEEYLALISSLFSN